MNIDDMTLDECRRLLRMYKREEEDKNYRRKIWIELQSYVLNKPFSINSSDRDRIFLACKEVEQVIEKIIEIIDDA